MARDERFKGRRTFNSLLGALAGKPEHPTLRTQLTQVYGRGPRGGPDTKRIADLFGVTQRTVQRWVKAGKLPESTHGQAAVDDIAAWRESPAGRTALLGPRRSERLATEGFAATIEGTYKISRETRHRTVTAAIDAAQAREIIDALRAGDDTAAHAALENAFGDAFGGSVKITIDHMAIAKIDE